jgi:hypothetical protein
MPAVADMHGTEPTTANPPASTMTTSLADLTTEQKNVQTGNIDLVDSLTLCRKDSYSKKKMIYAY